jgi:predicted phosphodiesterase
VRLAVVSDVHGNLVALDAVVADVERRAVDRVVHGGDLALGGWQPAEVIDRIRELDWPGVVGNVDELLWRPEARAAQERAAPKLRPLLGVIFDAHAPATRSLLGPERVGWLRALTAEHREEGLVVVHASPGDLWRAPPPDADDATLADAYARCAAPVVAYGHIHRPFVRRLDGFTVANAGSAGSPFDGDPRASYLLVEGDAVEVVRVAYDIEREVDGLLRSGYPDAERIAAGRRRGAYVAVR